MSLNISENIRYIGVDDTDLDLFEGQYIIPNGVSYNSYLIIDEKIAVMDTVDHRKEQEWLTNLSAALGERKPDYLVVHHLEPDHAGCIRTFAKLYPEAQIVATARALKMLPQFFEDLNINTLAVAEGDTLTLGTHKLTFYTAAMVHWPEVMVSYESTQKVLFSADGFGKFGALAHEEDWACEARRYYFNICGKYGGPVQALLKKAATLDIATICPLHGPILQSNLAYYIDLYNTWSSYQPENEGVFIAYASIHGNTAAVAHRLKEMLLAKGVERVAIADLSRDDMAEAVEDAFRVDRMVVAASSYDAGVFTPMHTFLHTLKMKGYQRRRVAIIENGSWAPSAGRVMKAMLEEMKDVEILQPMVTILSTLKPQDLPSLESLADAIAKR